MVTIYIKDVGVIKPGEETSGAYTGLNIVNGGTEIPLKLTRLRYARGISFDNAPQPGQDTSTGTFEEARLNFVSITNPLITLSGEIKTEGDLSSSSNVTNKITAGGTASITDYDGSSSTNEVVMLNLFDRLVKTKGYKELYYKEDSATTSIYGLGVKDSHTTSGALYRHLHIRVKSITIDEVPNINLINWSMICEVDRG